MSWQPENALYNSGLQIVCFSFLAFLIIAEAMHRCINACNGKDNNILMKKRLLQVLKQILHKIMKIVKSKCG